jgi:hypothetical protein
MPGMLGRVQNGLGGLDQILKIFQQGNSPIQWNTAASKVY